MRFKQPAQRQNSDDNLIPLINIIFLMLIFFMLAGRIAPRDVFAVTPPTSDTEQMPETEVIELLITADELALNGEVVTVENLTGLLSEKFTPNSTSVSESAAKQVPTITLKADANIDIRRLHQVLGQLRAAGSRKVTLLTARAG